MHRQRLPLKRRFAEENKKSVLGWNGGYLMRSTGAGFVKLVKKLRGIQTPSHSEKSSPGTPTDHTHANHDLSREIGARQRAEEALRQTTENLEQIRVLLEAILDQSPVPTVVASAPDHILRFGNRAAVDFLGIADESSYKGLTLAEVAKRQSWRELLPDGTPVGLHDIPITRTLRGEVVRNEEYQVIRKDGTQRWQLVSGTPVYSPGGYNRAQESGGHRQRRPGKAVIGAAGRRPRHLGLECTDGRIQHQRPMGPNAGL
jgi:PAS domain S-box-containing protein